MQDGANHNTDADIVRHHGSSNGVDHSSGGVGLDLRPYKAKPEASMGNRRACLFFIGLNGRVEAP